MLTKRAHFGPKSVDDGARKETRDSKDTVVQRGNNVAHLQRAQLATSSTQIGDGDIDADRAQ
jgi:hypothetical protein